MSIDGEVRPGLDDLVAGFVLHRDPNHHVAGVGVREDAEVVGEERANLGVVSVIVEHGKRFVVVGQDRPVESGDVDGWRGAEVFVDLETETVLPGHHGGAIVRSPFPVNDGQRGVGQQGVLCNLEGVSTDATEDLAVEIAPLIGDGHGVPDLTVNVGRNVKFSRDGVSGLKTGGNVVENEFPSVGVGVGEVVLVLAKRRTVMAPNGIGFVGFILVEPFEAHEVHRTDGVRILDSRRVGCEGVLKGNLEEILDQVRVVVRPVDVAVEGFRSHPVKRVRPILALGNRSVKRTDTVGNRAQIEEGFVLNELAGVHAVRGVPNVVDFALDAQLVVPSDSRRAVANELSMDVGGFRHPVVERIFLDGVGGAGIAGGLGVDDAR